MLIILVPLFLDALDLAQRAAGSISIRRWIPIRSATGTTRDARAGAVWTFALNSFIIVAGVISVRSSPAPTAYGFARLRAPGRDFIFLLLLATLMLPTTVTLVPTYIVFNKLGWLNSFAADRPAFFGTPFYIFLLRQFYLSIRGSWRNRPGSTARPLPDLVVDHAPPHMPALATVAVFTFFATYNDFFGPLIYLSD